MLMFSFLFCAELFWLLSLTKEALLSCLILLLSDGVTALSLRLTESSIMDGVRPPDGTYCSGTTFRLNWAGCWALFSYGFLVSTDLNGLDIDMMPDLLRRALWLAPPTLSDV